MATPQGESKCAVRSTSWDGVSRSHPEVAVAAPVLDLAPERKFHRELQKSMSFSNWKAEDEDHPLVYTAEPSPDTKTGKEKLDTKRSISPTESQKEQLESLRAAVKSDLRRAIMTRAHSPDNERANAPSFLKKKSDYPLYPAAVEKIRSLRENLSEDFSDVSPCTALDDSSIPWNEGISLSLSDDDNDYALDDYDWDDLEENDDELISPSSQNASEDLRQPWSTQPLDSFNDDEDSKKRFLKMMGKNKTHHHDYQYYRNRSLGTSGTSFIAYSKISVPTYKSISSEAGYDDENRPLPNRLCSGFIHASKQVLSSVWTWAVAAVLLAGVKTLTVYGSGGPVHESAPLPPTKYWVESNQLDFDWDDDVEFKLHRPSKK